jgi:hypothetical protein
MSAACNQPTFPTSPDNEFSGISALEYASIHIAAAIAGAAGPSLDPEKRKRIADIAVELARTVLIRANQ